ncbi:MAG: glycosyltransferase family 4 protein [Pyrinomonadaceae bacterium]|nr:glycosyltransferase family 4 protein [Sphingobacteriaceae bacterium]
MFSLTGGIEKVCRVFSRVLFDMGFELGKISVYSLYDKPADRDSKYINKASFRAFGKNRIWFVIRSLIQGLRADIVVLSHVNLLFVAVLIKAFAPKKRIVMYAHGIEVWRNLHWWKSSFLRRHCELWAVSEFTAGKLIEFKNADPQKIRVIPNCLDPFLEIPSIFNKPSDLLTRYHLTADQPVLFTLTRLSSFELYKGYDMIIESLPELIKTYSNLRYLLGGQADTKEQYRLDKLIERLHLTEHVIFTGFIPDEELISHFRLADIFIMPSRKEGFGIVFIEAAACGCKVIGGNQDGSREALLNGKLGTLIHPEQKETLLDAINENLEHLRTENSSRAIQSLCMEHFNYQQYLQRIQQVLLRPDLDLMGEVEMSEVGFD